MAFCERLGVGPFRVLQPEYSEKTYRGKPGNFKMRFAMTSLGPVDIELIEPLEGESVYTDFLKGRGGGIHHLAFDVPDLDAAVKTFKSLGVDVVMSGVRKGLRFAYLDAEEGGLVLELIERHG
jgi:Glyoxalase/Bleomycin resistance protein/Dioxygenase superfamily